MRLADSAIAYSATTVLPADVCAATSTDSSRSMCMIAAFWNVSSSNANSSAMCGTCSRKRETSLTSIAAHSRAVWPVTARCCCSRLRVASSMCSSNSSDSSRVAVAAPLVALASVAAALLTTSTDSGSTSPASN